MGGKCQKNHHTKSKTKQIKQQQTLARKATLKKNHYRNLLSRLCCSESALNGYMREAREKRPECQKWHIKRLQSLSVCVCSGGRLI